MEWTDDDFVLLLQVSATHCNECYLGTDNAAKCKLRALLRRVAATKPKDIYGCIHDIY